jgi:hypothetical protein
MAVGMGITEAGIESDTPYGLRPSPIYGLSNRQLVTGSKELSDTARAGQVA